MMSDSLRLDAHTSYTQAGLAAWRTRATERNGGDPSIERDIIGVEGSPCADPSRGFLGSEQRGVVRVALRAEKWRRWIPSSIQGFEFVRYTNASGALKYVRNPHAVTLADGSVLVATSVRDSTSAATEYRIEVSKRSTTGAWSTATVATSGTAPTAVEHPALLILPSGRVVVYYVIFDAARSTANVRSYQSDDDGATWTLHETAVLDTDVSTSTYTPGRLRVAYAGGTVLLVLLAYQSSATTKILQYASKDLGSKFEFIETLDSGVSEVAATSTVFAKGLGLDLAVSSGVFVLIANNGSLSQLAARRTASAYIPVSSATVLATGFAAVPPVSPAVTVEPDGTLWLFSYQYANTGSGLFSLDGVVVRSTDGGVTWVQVGQSSRMADNKTRWWCSNLGGRTDAAPYPTALSATATQGRIALLCNHLGNPGTSDDSLACLYLGGWSTVTMPSYGRFPKDTTRVSWETTRVPFDEPDDATTWAYTTAGSASTRTLGDGLTVNSPGGSTATYSRTPPGVYTEPIIIRAAVAVTSGGDLARDDVSIKLRLDDTGSNSFDVSIRLSTAGIRVVDNVSGSQVGSDCVVDTTGAGVEILACLVGGTVGKFSMWYRLRSMASDRPWIEGPIAQSTSNGAGGSGHSIAWGHGGATGTATARVSVWYEFHDVSDEWSGANNALAEGQQNPADLFGHPYSTAGAYVDDGVSVHLTGQTARADQWSIPTRYDYELARALPSTHRPSPRIEHRTTSTAAQTYAWQIPLASGAADSYHESDLLGICVSGTNWPQFTVSGYSSASSSWVALATVDLSEGLTGLRYLRSGATVRPDPAGASTSSPFLYADEARGWRWWYPSVARKIRGHLGGKWGQVGRRVTLPLTDVSAADSGSGTDGRIVPDSVAVVIPLNGATYTGWKIEVPAPSATIPKPVEDYYKAGFILIGPVHVFGEDTSWGRVIETTPGESLITMEDRTSRSVVNAPPQRRVEFAWTDMVDTTQATAIDGAPSPDYFLGGDHGSAEAVASIGAEPWDLEGLIRRLNGSHVPICYLPKWEKLVASGHATMNRRHSHVLARLEGAATIETVLGEELESEVVRVAKLTAVEVV